MNEETKKVTQEPLDVDSLPEDLLAELAAKAAETGKTIYEVAEEVDLPGNEEPPKEDEEEIIRQVEEEGEKTEETEEEDIETDKGEEEKEQEQKDETASFDDYIEALVERGLVDKERIEDIETLDDLIALNEEIAEKIAEEKLKSLEDKIGEDGVKLLNFLAKGGTVQEFVEFMGETSDLPSYTGDERSAETVIRYYLKNIKQTSDDEVELIIEAAKEKGKLDDLAQRYDKQIKEYNEKKLKEVELQKKRAQQEAMERQKKLMEDVNSILSKPEEYIGVPLPAEVKKEVISLFDFDSDGSYKLKKKFDELLTDPKNLVKLAMLIADDFKFDRLLNTAKSRAAKEVKKKISYVKAKGRTEDKRKDDIWETIRREL